MNNPTATIPAKRQAMPVLPDDIVAYKQTAQFAQNTVPKKLVSEHTTKAGTWGVLNIGFDGLIYRITEPGHEAENVLGTNTRAVIVAEQPHYISTMGDVSFHTEFYRRAEAE